jgi:hypothetical protein
MADTTEPIIIKCSQCRKKFTLDGFKVNRFGVRNKTCLECAARKKVYQAAHKEDRSEKSKERWRVKTGASYNDPVKLGRAQSNACIHGNPISWGCRSCVVPDECKCAHGYDKKVCRQCGAGAFCIHDKVRGSCVECKKPAADLDE